MWGRKSEWEKESVCVGETEREWVSVCVREKEREWDAEKEWFDREIEKERWRER